MESGIRQLIEDETDLLKSRAEAMERVLKLERESLELLKAREDYDREISADVGDVASIRSRMSELEGDDSPEGRARYSQLAEKLASAQAELSDAQLDRYAEVYKKSLDAMEAQFEAVTAAKLESLASMLTQMQRVQVTNYINVTAANLASQLASAANSTADEITRALSSGVVGNYGGKVAIAQW